MDRSSSILTGNIVNREKKWQKIRKNLRKYEKIIGNGSFVAFEGKGTNPKVKINKTIWICWFQGISHAPTVVGKCVESIEKNKPEDFEIVYLSDQNRKEYVLFPEYIEEKLRDGRISYAHFSDLLRAELLYLYGGLWIDATVYCAKKIPEYMCSGKLFAFRWSLLDCSVVSISSWWLYAAQGQAIISDTRNMLFEYWKNEVKLRDYYLFHIIFSMAKERTVSNRNTFSEMIYVNNSEPHILFGKLGQCYDGEEWDIIRNNMPIQKLSYKKHIIQGDIYNYHTVLMDGGLLELRKNE